MREISDEVQIMVDGELARVTVQPNFKLTHHNLP